MKPFFQIASICLVAALLLVSCHQKKSEKRLSKEEMISVLFDMSLVEAQLKSSAALIPDSLRPKAEQEKYFPIFRKHQITPSDFSRSVDYYLNRIETFEDISTQVFNRLTQYQAQLEVKQKASDTLNAAGKDTTTTTTPVKEDSVRRRIFDRMVREAVPKIKKKG